MKSPDIVVTKMDAARRQLHAAIRMWFAEDDPVPIHTLAHSAHEVLHRLFRNRGLKGLVFDSALIPPEHQSEFARVLKMASGFFKHAKYDGQEDASITFDTSLNDMYIVMSVAALQRMEIPLVDQEYAVVFWLKCTRPELFPEDPREVPIPVEVRVEVRQIGRIKFFQEFMQGRWPGFRLPI